MAAKPRSTLTKTRGRKPVEEQAIKVAALLETELSPAAARAKAKVVERLIAAGTNIDQCEQLIDSFCESFAEWLAASEAIKQHGVLVQGLGGTLKKSPAVEIRRDAAQLMIRLAEQLGMTPKAQHLMGDSAAMPKAREALDEFLST